MTRISILVCAVAVAAGGCGKDKDGGSGESAGKTSEAKPKSEPFTGTLTRERVQSVQREHADRGASWADAIAVVESMVGKPTAVEGDTHMWAVTDGEKCAYLKLEKSGDKVGSRESGEVDKMMKAMFAECAKAAGQASDEEAEDPNAPGPPEDGSAVTVNQVVDGVAKAKSKWMGEKVTMKGYFVSSTKATANGVESYTISIGGDADNLLETTVGCSIGDTAPPELTQKVEITVEGTVTDMFDGHLDDCTVK